MTIQTHTRDGKSCARCGHPEQHTDMVGCLHDDGRGGYCDCPAFVDPETQAQDERTLTEATGIGTTQANLAEGRRRRDEGTARAGDGAPAVLVSAWKAKAQEALDRLVATGEPFSADDLVLGNETLGVEAVGEPPHPNLLGALFRVLSASGKVQPVGYQSSVRPSAHARVQRIWVRA